MRMADKAFAKRLSKMIASEKNKGSEATSDIEGASCSDPRGCKEINCEEEPSCRDEVIHRLESVDGAGKAPFEEKAKASTASAESYEQNDTRMEVNLKGNSDMELAMFSFEDIVASQLRDISNNCRNDWISSESEFATLRVPTNVISSNQSRFGNFYQLEEKRQSKITERQRDAYFIDFDGFDNMRRKKHQGLSNFYDVPTEYTIPRDESTEEVYDTTLFRMREKLHVVTQNKNISTYD
mmetsp:Transcript_20645/g.43357  ORF Transcript_20645/g.43357 Transcript_20645/m.43357 type:complete len:239 (+) Transcript_20645:206-922(+)